MIKSLNIIQKAQTFTGYKLQDRIKFHGLNISIENRKGSVRKWKDEQGNEGQTKMLYPYGYIRGSEGQDGDKVDCYIGPDKDAEFVYVVHQNVPETGKYDEDKCLLGFDSASEAKKAYLKHYDNPKFFGSMTTITIDEFKEKVKNTLHSKNKIIKAILKARQTKYIKRIPKAGRGYKSLILKAKEGLVPIKLTVSRKGKTFMQTFWIKQGLFSALNMLSSFFGVNKLKAKQIPKDEYKKKDIKKNLGIDYNTWENHFTEYFKNKSTWDAKFKGKVKTESVEKVKQAIKKEKTTYAKKTVKGKTVLKKTYSMNVMRHLHNLYGKKEVKEIESKEEIKPITEKEPVEIATKEDIKKDTINSIPFKNWFGSSKVLNENGEPAENYPIEKSKDRKGKPVIVYHGTSEGGWSSFEKEKIGEGNLYGKGFYFTEDKDIAKEYATKTSMDFEVDMKHLKTITIGENLRPIDMTFETVDKAKEALAMSNMKGIHRQAEDFIKYKTDPKFKEKHDKNKKLRQQFVKDYIVEAKKGYVENEKDLRKGKDKFLNSGAIVDLIEMESMFSEKRYIAPYQLKWLSPLEKKYNFNANLKAEIKEVYLKIENPIDLDDPVQDKMIDDLFKYNTEKAIQEYKEMEDYKTDSPKEKKRYSNYLKKTGGFHFKHLWDDEKLQKKALSYFKKKGLLEKDSPFIMDGDLESTKENVKQILKWLAKDEESAPTTNGKPTLQHLFSILSDGNYSSRTKNNLAESFQKMGYDGMSHTGGWNIGEKDHKVWIAFEPEQIKSTQAKKFDSKSVDIYKAKDSQIVQCQDGKIGIIAERIGNINKVIKLDNNEIPYFGYEKDVEIQNINDSVLERYLKIFKIIKYHSKKNLNKARALPVGTHRTYGQKEYQKISQNEWTLVKNKKGSSDVKLWYSSLLPSNEEYDKIRTGNINSLASYVMKSFWKKNGEKAIADYTRGFVKAKVEGFDIEDIAQETAMRMIIMQNNGKFLNIPRKKFPSFVASTFANTSRDISRRMKAGKEISIDLENLSKELSSVETSDSEQGIENAAMKSINNMKNKEKNILRQFITEGNHKTVSEKLNISETATRKSVSRSYEKFRSELAKEGINPPDKKKAISILRNILRKNLENQIAKAKVAQIGEIRTHGGVQMKKIAPNKWEPVDKKEKPTEKEKVSKDEKRPKKDKKGMNKIALKEKMAGAIKGMLNILAETFMGHSSSQAAGQAVERQTEKIKEKLSGKNREKKRDEAA